MGFPWGLDFGNQNCVIAIARKGGIDVIDNEASSRKVSPPATACHPSLQGRLETARVVASRSIAF